MEMILSMIQSCPKSNTVQLLFASARMLSIGRRRRFGNKAQGLTGSREQYGNGRMVLKEKYGY